jgi:hypothetical protein
MIGRRKTDCSELFLTYAFDHCIGFTDFVSFYLQYTNLYNFVFVTKDWDVRYMSYFASTQTIALTVFGIMAGAIMSYTRDVKVSHDRGGMRYIALNLPTDDVTLVPGSCSGSCSPDC